MSVPTFTPKGDNPYPPVEFDSSPKAIERLAEATRDWPRPELEPRYGTVGELMDAQAAAAELPPLDVRIPGATLHTTEAASFAAFTPAPAPAPEPPAAEPFPGWLRDFLLSMIDDAAYGVGAALDRPCPLDRHHATGWCEECEGLYERAGRYARLQDLLLVSSETDSAAAVRTLLAEGWR